jgi:hypothetical protein
MNNKDKIRQELENDKIWKQLCASATPEQLSQVNAALNELFKAAGEATENFASAISKEKVTDEQVASAISDRRG